MDDHGETTKLKDALDMGWTGAVGAAKFSVAVIKGDLAPASVIEARRAVCRECPHLVRSKLFGARSESLWCGQILRDHRKRDPECSGCGAATCGCLLAGKTAVGSETCPVGRWKK